MTNYQELMRDIIKLSKINPHESLRLADILLVNLIKESNCKDFKELIDKLELPKI